MSSPGEDVDTVSELLLRRVNWLNGEIVGIRAYSLSMISFMCLCWYITREVNDISIVELFMCNLICWIILTLIRTLLVLYARYGNPGYRLRQYFILPIILNSQLDVNRIRAFVESNAQEFAIRPGCIARITRKWNNMIAEEVDLFYV